MNNIYIGPRNIEKVVLNELLEKEPFINFKYIDINEYIDSFNTHKDDISTVKLKLKNLKKSLTTYKNIFDEKDNVNFSFIKEVISIKDELVKYNLLFDLDISSLNIDPDLKLILDNIDISYDFVIPSDCSYITVVDINYSLINNAIISKLKENGAKSYLPIKQVNKSFLYKTRSIRDEMEFVVQYIIKKELDINKCGVVLSDSSNINLFKTVLNHYNVPFTTSHRDINSSAYKTVCVLDYVVSPSVENYRNIVNSNLCFAANEAINKYLINHVADTNELYKEFNKYQNEDNKSYFKNLEAKANEIHEHYIKLLNDIKGVSSFDIVLKRILEDLPKDEDTKVLVNKINTILVEDLTIDNYENIRKTLLSLKKAPIILESALEITDLATPIINKEYLFVLDCSSSNYPGFKPLNSILKEEDVINTKYPSLKDRKLNYLDVLKYLDYAKNTIYVCPNSTYAGKSEELAYELLNANLEELDFVLVSTVNEYNEKHRIKKDVITSKHIIDNSIHGSVSKFETFVKCPYAYFAKYGLGLYEEKAMDLNAATVGTIMHGIMEKLVNTKHKDYPQYTDAELKQLISTYVDDLRKHYPNKSKVIDFFNDRIFNSLKLEKKFLIPAEEETKFIPTLAEEKFKHDLTTKSNVVINLEGTIDRVDLSDGYFRIIDYKTSDHVINKDKVKAGEQLQLFTYAYVYTEKSNNTPLGVFYLMLNHESEVVHYYKYALSEGGFVQITDTDLDNFISNHKMSSFGFTSPSGLFINPKCVRGITSKGEYRSSHIMEYGDMKALLFDVYSQIIEDILKGEFNPKYDKNRCKYCRYSTMCHNRFSRTEEDDEA